MSATGSTIVVSTRWPQRAAATWVGAAFGHRLGLVGLCEPKPAHEVSVGSVCADLAHEIRER